MQHSVKRLPEVFRKEGDNQWESSCGRDGWKEITGDLSPVLPPIVSLWLCDLRQLTQFSGPKLPR